MHARHPPLHAMPRQFVPGVGNGLVLRSVQCGSRRCSCNNCSAQGRGEQGHRGTTVRTSCMQSSHPPRGAEACIRFVRNLGCCNYTSCDSCPPFYSSVATPKVPARVHGCTRARAHAHTCTCAQHNLLLRMSGMYSDGIYPQQRRGLSRACACAGRPARAHAH